MCVQYIFPKPDQIHPPARNSSSQKLLKLETLKAKSKYVCM